MQGGLETCQVYSVLLMAVSTLAAPIQYLRVKGVLSLYTPI